MDNARDEITLDDISQELTQIRDAITVSRETTNHRIESIYSQLARIDRTLERMNQPEARQTTYPRPTSPPQDDYDLGWHHGWTYRDRTAKPPPTPDP